MKLKEIMTRGVECVSPGTTLADAAERMRDLDVGCLPVCGDDDRLAGVVTDRDITIRGTAEHWDPEMRTVAEVMTPEISYCFEEDDLEEAARIMEEKQIRRLAVLNSNKRLVGIVSLGDLAVRGKDSELSAEALEEISEPAALAS